MDLKISGIVVAILPEASGTSASSGKAWSKRDFVIQESEGQWPKQIAFTVFNKPEMIADMRVDDEVEVGFNVESREYNGKYFSNVTAWKVNITKTSGAKPKPADDLPPMGDTQSGGDQKDGDDLPF